jgi:polyphenol oxidase
VHCAYCTGSLRQPGRPDRPLQIHLTWLFFLFHRAYIYFFERIIAAKLLGDPGFRAAVLELGRLARGGIPMPDAFADRSSPLYDPRWNARHWPRAQGSSDLEFMEEEKNYTDEQHIQRNLWVMHKQVPTHSHHSRLST